MFPINFIQAVYISAGYKKTLGFFEKKRKKLVHSDKKPATSRVKTEFYNPLSLSLSWFLGDVKFYSADRGEKLIKQASECRKSSFVRVRCFI